MNNFLCFCGKSSREGGKFCAFHCEEKGHGHCVFCAEPQTANTTKEFAKCVVAKKTTDTVLMNAKKIRMKEENFVRHIAQTKGIHL